MSKKKLSNCMEKGLLGGLVLILSLVYVGSLAGDFQDQIVTGKVTSAANGEGIPGVNVLIKGTGIGVVTGIDGDYSISVPDSEGAILVFSYIGFVSQEVRVGNQSVVNITLNEDLTTLDEVVVIGYGTQSQRNVTGSISKVDMEDTQNLPNTNISQSLRGRVAGVQFIDDGRPGQNGSILIRGPRSLSGGNSPLIVLDGIFFNGTIANINPNDIETIEVLKDASAAAIYGSRAANGVILITSKRGTTAKPTITLSSYVGFSDWGYRPKILGPERYLQKTLDARKLAGLEANPENIADYLTVTERENYENGIVTDPWEAISQQGKIESYDVSVSGRTELTNYFLSASFFDEQGIIFNDNRERVSIRSNIENKITDDFTIGFNAFYSRQDLSGIAANPSNALVASPYGRWYYDDGRPTLNYVPEDIFRTNAMRIPLLTENKDIFNNLFSNFFLKLDIPFIEGLSFRLNYSPNYRWEQNYTFENQDIHIPDVNNTRASKGYRNQFDWVLENILTYTKELNENNEFDLTLMYGKNKFSWETTSSNAERLSEPSVKWNNLGFGEVLTNSSDAAEISGISTMARLNYRLLSKYLFTVTARRDGSSVFGADNKYAVFPSAAFAWIMSEESFINGIQPINNLKLRLSYGAVGNQAIEPYQSLAGLGSTLYVFGDGGDYSVGYIPFGMANSSLKWETTYNFNVALDFELLDRRIGGTIEYYNMDTKDLLIRRSLPNITGYTSVLANLGATSNKGIELALNTVNVKHGKFSWNSSVVFSHNKNEIVSLYGVDSDGDGIEDNDLGNSWLIGEPIDVAYDYIIDGVYQVEDQDQGHTAGDIRLKDLNNDGEIGPDDDRTIVGQTGQPLYRWGFTNTFNFGNLQLSVFINSMQGWIGSIDYFRSALRPQNMYDYEWWTEENRSNSSPSFNYTNPLGHDYYYSRDFIRIQDISLSYDFSSLPFIHNSGIKNLRMWISGKNLLTLTDWPGMDPENGNSYDDFPMPKTYSAGFSISF